MRRLYITVLVAFVLVAGCVVILASLAFGAWWWQRSARFQHDTPPGRLLVLDFDGHIRTMRPDGSDVRTLTEDDPHGLFRQEPMWSPDGRWVAWVSEYPEQGGYSPALSIARADGSERHDVILSAVPVYLAWRPTSDAIAVLLPDDVSGLSLVLIDRENGDKRVLSRGQPFYFDWSPDGRELLAHIDRRLVLLDMQGHEAMLAHTEGRFAAPDWSDDGQMWAYAVSSAESPRLVIRDRNQRTTSRVSEFDGRIAFAFSPDGTQIAYIPTAPSSTLPTLGPLWLLNRQTGVLREVSAAPVLAFFWSPDGRTLAFLRYEVDEHPTSPTAPETGLQRVLWQTPATVWFRWHIWDGERTYPTAARFRPGGVYASEYVRFFDQYARTTQFWSPDGRAFVFAGEVEGERNGIWVQPVGESAPPRWVGTGHVAFWSPHGD